MIDVTYGPCSPVTIWERGTEDDEKGKKTYAHNHITEGFPNSLRPRPVNDAQEKAWSGATWRSRLGAMCGSKVIEI